MVGAGYGFSSRSARNHTHRAMHHRGTLIGGHCGVRQVNVNPLLALSCRVNQLFCAVGDSALFPLRLSGFVLELTGINLAAVKRSQ